MEAEQENPIGGKVPPGQAKESDTPTSTVESQTKPPSLPLQSL